MYLIVDFSELNLQYETTDIRLDESNADYTVGKLITELCKGIERFGNEEIKQKANLRLQYSNGSIIDSTCIVSDLHLNDWDTVYLVNRR